MTPFWGAILALASNLFLSLGMLLQKRHIGWVEARKKRSRGHARAALGWVAGFTLMNLSPIPRFFALQGLSVNVVNAFMGTSVAMTAILGIFLLKEVPTRRQAAWMVILLLALVTASAHGGGVETAFDRHWFLASFALPTLLGFVAWILRAKRRSKGLAVFLALASGALGGFMNLAMKAVQSGGLGLAVVVFYVALYTAAGVLSFVLIQFAYKDGDMSTVSPAMYGFTLLWPAFSSYWVFRSPFDPVQALALGAIALAVFMISRPGPAATGTAA